MFIVSSFPLLYLSVLRTRIRVTAVLRYREFYVHSHPPPEQKRNVHSLLLLMGAQGVHSGVRTRTHMTNRFSGPASPLG